MFLHEIAVEVRVPAKRKQGTEGGAGRSYLVQVSSWRLSHAVARAESAHHAP